MNSDFSDDMDLDQLERELQSLTPIAPRRELVQAIKARMEPVPRRVQDQRNRVATFPWRRMVAPAAAAAAAVAVFNLDDHRRTSKPPQVAANEPATPATPAIAWEPMPMLPEFQEYLDKGYLLTQDLEQFVHPQYAALFNIPVLRLSDDKDTTMRVSVPRRNRVIMPAGHRTGQTTLRWQ